MSRLKTATIRDVTTALAAPEMQGRGVGQTGGDRAARYLAVRFKAMGLKPAGDTARKSYLQTIAFEESELSTKTLFQVTGGTTPTVLTPGRDYVPLPLPPQMPQAEEASGEVVFVGYGMVSKDLNRDDLTGRDLKDKIVVVYGGPGPKSADETAWKRAANPQALLMALVTRGAKGIVVAGFPPPQGLSFAAFADYLVRRQVQFPSPSTPPSSAPPFTLPPVVLLSTEAAGRLFSAGGTTGVPSFTETVAALQRGENVPENRRVLSPAGTLRISRTRQRVQSSNVVGFLEGSDPKLKQEAVVFTAHYDAYGSDTRTGTIYPGAADNALGVGEMVGLAEAIAKSPKRPRRSVLFIALTAEEYGLLGSRYWVNNPTWPLERVVANLNFDGIGTEVYGPVKQSVAYGREFSSLGATFSGVAQALGVIIVPDPLPEEQVFTRSDHFTFVQQGIPALMPLGGPAVTDPMAQITRIKGWLTTHYHQPTDTVRPEWNWEGARTVAALQLLTGLRVAGADAAPHWLPTSPYQRKENKGATVP